MNKKIFFYGKSFGKKNITGVERVTVELLSGLAQKDDVEIVICGSRFLRKIEGKNVKHRKMFWLNDITYMLFFGVISKLQGANVILSTLSLVCAFPIGIKQVVCVHDLAWKHYRGRFTYLQIIYFEFIHWLSSKLADIIYCPSQATMADIKKFYKVNGRVEVVPWGGDHFRIYSGLYAARYFRDNYGLSFKRINTIVSLGTLQPRKGYEFIINSLCRYEEPITYIIFGSKGWMSDDIVDKINKFNINNTNNSKIVWIDNASDKLISSTFRLSRLFVLASEYEGFGLPVVEAMRSGCPVAVSNNSSLKELISHNQYSFEYGNCDQLVSIFDLAFGSSHFRKIQSEVSRNRSNSFKWWRSVDKLIHIIDALKK